MRVLYLNPCGQMGGAETSLYELLASVRRAAPDWELMLVLGEDGPMAGRARKLGIEVIVAAFPSELAQLGDLRQGRFATLWALTNAFLPVARYTRRLAAIIKSRKPDVVHTNGFKMHLLGALACPGQTALVWHIHDYASTRALMSRLLRWRSRRVSVAIANSLSVAADLKKLYPDLKVTPIYNAIDLERYAPTGAGLDLDAIAGLPPSAPGTIRVGLVATFARWKGHKVFLQALSKLPAGSPIRGFVIGGPIYRTGGSQWSMEELQGTASQLGLDGRVGFTSFLDDTAAAMRSLDIIVHASVEPEPFGMVIVEGMACGKAVIAGRAGGSAELFVDGENAMGHSPGDAEGLARQIERLASDPELRQRLGRAGRVQAERLCGGARLAGEMLALYRQVAPETGDRTHQPVTQAITIEPRRS